MKLKWIPAPVYGNWKDGKRWLLVSFNDDGSNQVIGRVVQLLDHGHWSIHTRDFDSSGYSALSIAAQELLVHARKFF